MILRPVVASVVSLPPLLVQSATPRTNLANNRKTGDTASPLALRGSILNHSVVCPAFYVRNYDAVKFAQSDIVKGDVIEFDGSTDILYETFYLSSIVRKIELGGVFDSKKTIYRFEEKRIDFDNTNLEQVAALAFGIIEAEEIDKGVQPCSCGRKVMSEKLHKKLFGASGLSSPANGGINIVKSGVAVSYSGLMYCKNVWGCPICTRKVSEKRKIGLQKLLSSHVEKYGSDTITASLFTIPHTNRSDLKDILDRLIEAYTVMTRTRVYKDFINKTLGGRGSSRATECTYSLTNGYHPHIHVLNFFDTALDFESYQLLSDTLYNLWVKACLKLGFEMPVRRAFGCKIIPTDTAALSVVADYFSKSEADVNDDDIEQFLNSKKNKTVRQVGKKSKRWAIEHEITKWHLKTDKTEKSKDQDGNKIKVFRYSMFDFLRGYAFNDIAGNEQEKQRFAALWLEYRSAFKGKRQLFTRHKDFKIPELMLSDADLIDFETGEIMDDKPASEVILSLDFITWQLVVMFKARASLLVCAKYQGKAAALQFIKQLWSAYYDLPTHRQILDVGDDFKNGVFL